LLRREIPAGTAADGDIVRIERFATRSRFYRFVDSMSASRPFRISSGAGGQPGTWRSTGITAETPPTTA
jgi:hypothetical protein